MEDKKDIIQKTKKVDIGYSKKEEKAKKREEKKREKVGKKEARPKQQGLHNIRVAVLWLLLIAAFAFAVYKNFTGIDKHTVHEKEVIKEEIYNTQGIEEYASGFMEEYFTWDAENLKGRSERLSEYLDASLIPYAGRFLPDKVDSSSMAYSCEVWDVEKESDMDYTLTFQISQKLVQGGAEKYIGAGYEVGVHVDEGGNMLITRLPAVAVLPKRSDYQLEMKEGLQDLDTDVKQGIESFLNDFFKFYPTLTQKELSYYVTGNAVSAIGCDWLEFMQIEDMAVTSYEDGKAGVYAVVSYKDSSMGTTQTFQYDLDLKKGETWKIISMELGQSKTGRKQGARNGPFSFSL